MRKVHTLADRFSTHTTCAEFGSPHMCRFHPLNSSVQCMLYARAPAYKTAFEKKKWSLPLYHSIRPWFGRADQRFNDMNRSLCSLQVTFYGNLIRSPPLALRSHTLIVRMKLMGSGSLWKGVQKIH